MQLHHHQRRGARTYRAAAALLTCLLSLLLSPIAHGEPLEGDLLESGTTASQSDRGWEHRNDLEFLNQHDEAAQPPATRSIDTLRQERHLRLLEGQEAPTAGEPAVETSADDSGLPWLLGAGVVAMVAVASIALALVRSRRPEIVTAAQRDREELNA